MPKAADTAALTRQQAEDSHREWERLQNLHKVSMSDLTQFGKESASNSLQELSNLLTGDLENADTLWKICQQIKLVTNQDEAYKRKISAVETIVSKMESEILNTPAHLTQAEGAITVEDRQHEVALRLEDLDVAREVYNEWETRFRRAKATYKLHSHLDGTPKTEPQDDLEPGAGRRPRSRDRTKLGSDAKSLKPEPLTIQLSARQTQDWFWQFENYRLASGWS